jgi:hypothetical protein
VNVRIPDSPARFEALCYWFAALHDDAIIHGDPWPDDLDEWADMFERRHEGARRG